MDAAGVDVGAGQQHPCAHELQVEPRRGGAAHVGESLGDDLRRAGQLAGPQPAGLRREPLGLVGGDVDEAGAQRVRHRRDDDEVAEPAQEVLGEAARVLADVEHLVDAREDARGVAGGEGVHDFVEERVGGVPQQRRGLTIGHPAMGGPAEQLVEHGQRVADRPGARPHDQRQHGRIDVDPLLGAQAAEVGAQRPRRHQPEGVVVRPRADRAEHLLGLGRGEDELDVRRGLLDHLEQGVEAVRGDHVGLVDDVDLVPAVHGVEERALAQRTGILDQTVARGVHLDDVDRPGPAAGQVAARPALAARGGRGPLLAVEAAGQDAGRRGLAAAARAGEQVGVVDPVVGQRALQGHRHMVLPDDLGEGVWPVPAI